MDERRAETKQGGCFSRLQHPDSEVVTEARDDCADDALSEDEDRYVREPVSDLLLLLRLPVTIVTLCSVHVTHTRHRLGLIWDIRYIFQTKRHCGLRLLSVQCYAMHWQNINLPVCVSVCVCPSHFLTTRLQVRPIKGFLQLIA